MNREDKFETMASASSKGSRRETYKMVIIAPTPFYYQVPMFRALAQHPRIDLHVYYCSNESLEALDVARRYNTESRWGDEQDLLEGYEYKFLRNYSPFPSYMRSAIGLLNLGVWIEILKSKPDVVVLMSWMNPTWWLAVSACAIMRVPFLYLTDQNIQRESSNPRWKVRIKSLLLGRLLFRLASGFLCAGTANRRLYQHYGVPEEKLVPFAFSWGYESLLQSSEEILSQRTVLRTEMGIPEDSYVILFCGRLSPEKGLSCLLRAYDMLEVPGKVLAIVGDGPLMRTLQDYCVDRSLESVHFFGFQNRKDISKFYALSDVLVLPSYEDSWGLVVSESLCFGLPVVTSDHVGASLDLVRDGHNGFIFPAGDTEALAEKLQRLADMPEGTRLKMGENSRRLIEHWSNRDLVQSLDQYLDWLFTGKREIAGHRSSK